MADRPLVTDPLCGTGRQYYPFRMGGRGGPGQGVSTAAQEERATQGYNRNLLYGITRKAARKSKIWDGGGVLGPGGACTKIGRPIREVIQEKNPHHQKIDDAVPIKSTFELYEEVPDAVFLEMYGSYVEVVARHIRGAGGSGGADAKVLKDWCTRFSSGSEHL